MASKPNYKMLTFQKIIDEIGVSKDKDIFNLQIEDLCKIKNFQRVDLENIIETRKVIKSEINIKLKQLIDKKKAQSYSDNQHMSKQRLYEQLTSTYGEGFDASSAQYAIDHVVADYNYNALQKAKSYRKNQSMSKNRLYEQLTSSYGEGFTASEAEQINGKKGQEDGELSSFAKILHTDNNVSEVQFKIV